MRLEILGSGGAVTTPKPLCPCATCLKARSGNVRDSRFGPSLFIHGPHILIDTPEEISLQLNRSQVTRIEACFYSHWHPDHTSGKRVFEMNKDWIGTPPRNKTTKVYLTQKVWETFSEFLGLKSHFDFMASGGLIDLNVVGNAETFQTGDYEITPVQMAEDYSFGFDLRGEGKRILIIMDELKDWKPSKAIREAHYDLVYLPIGIVDVNPITGVRLIDENHALLKGDQSLQETLEYVRTLHSRQFILGHVEEPDGITFEMGEKIGKYSSEFTGKNVTIAYDTLVCEI